MSQTATARVMWSINRTAILDLIRQKSFIARSEIARQLHVSFSTVMRVVEDLIAEDLVRYHGSRGSTGGRPSALLEFNGKAYAVIGVDLGGARLFGTVADLAGAVQHEMHLPRNGQGPEENLEQLCELIERLLEAPRPPEQRIRGIGIIPILRVSSARYALSMTEALHAAGLNTVEIPMGVPDAIGIISTIVERYEDKVLVGAGTVMDVDAAATVIAAGASYVVSPSLDLEVVQYCNASDIMVIPGALTPTEIVAASKAGADMVKIFPCSTMGGPSYLKALKALKVPLMQIDLMPTGGVTLQNAAAFIEAGARVLGVGGDLIEISALREGKLDRITERARLYMELVREARDAQNTVTPPPVVFSQGKGI